MVISAKEAGELVGLSKAGVIKAIKTGRISGQKNLDGEWQVDTSELLRVYQPVPTVHTNGNSEVSAGSQSVHTPDTDGMQVEVKLLRELLVAKEQVITTQASTIEILTQENARLSAVITGLTPAKAKTGWWQRLLGTKE
jgi:hypothetical protein